MLAKFTANQVYSVIKNYQLTDEQAAAVEQAAIDAPSLIVAGAGSGKTELMAVRVLWLVANGYARPEQILGLTFTRKAAAELGKRIYDSLLKLRDTELWPEDLEYDFKAPNISTYNSYANNLFRDNALAIGYEPEAALLTDAAAYQLAREVVFKQGSKIDARLGELDSSANSIVEKVLDLAAAMNDNLVSAEQVEAEIERVIQAVDGLPKKSGSNDTAPYAYMIDYLSSLMPNATLAKLAAAYVQEKRRQGYVDYSDQVALAERAVRDVPGARERERELYSQVLLDEYQDTSFLQTKLLQNLFAKSSVFAVGDPNQSIYGWRGASASNLNSFYSDFGAAESAKPFSLSTSWRNPKSVLGLANELIGDLKVLELAAAPKAGDGKVQIKFEADIKTEADSVATWFKQRVSGDATAALLLRKRRQMPLFVEALESAGLSVEVVGLGGLLEVPEVVDLVSALRAIHNPAAGSALIRLLTGPRWRIGAKDIERLHRYANLRSRIDEELREKQQEGLAPEDATSLIDALDLLVDDKAPEKTGISDVGLVRMKDAALLLRAMRTQTGIPLVEFVRAVEQELWLDIEVQANPRRKNPMAHLNAFASIVSGYANANHQPTLSSFLNWLDFADERERFESPTPAPEAGVVQIMTVHAAKGLEWDHVAVANLIDGDFPDTNKGTKGWLATGVLPYPLRGDHESLPKLNLNGVTTQQAAKEAIEDFKAEVGQHQLKEELRLMYVAITRPKQELLLTGSYWKPGAAKERQASQFILRAAEFLKVQLPANANEANPLAQDELIETWPLDPLGEKHRRVLIGAEQKVTSAIDSMATKVLGVLEGDRIQTEIDLLLGEADARIAKSESFDIPVRIAASSFKEYVGQFEALAERNRRPMPQPPYKQTRSGTIFHGWVEQYFDRLALSDANFSVDDSVYGEDIVKLQENFAKSRFSKLIPIDVEREIQLTIGSHTFICKLDAVFETENGVEIVDWKTGKAPKDKADAEAKTLQLALYRLAYAKFTGRALEEIDVSFYFVSDNQELRPEKVPNENELLELWQRVITKN